MVGLSRGHSSRRRRVYASPELGRFWQHRHRADPVLAHTGMFTRPPSLGMIAGDNVWQVLYKLYILLKCNPFEVYQFVINSCAPDSGKILVGQHYTC